jgi:hypothetical protein
MDGLTGHKAGKKGKDASILPVVQVAEPGSPSEGSTGEPSPMAPQKEKEKPPEVAQPSASYFKLYRCVNKPTAIDRSTSIPMQPASCDADLCESAVCGRSRPTCTDRHICICAVVSPGVLMLWTLCSSHWGPLAVWVMEVSAHAQHVHQVLLVRDGSSCRKALASLCSQYQKATLAIVECWQPSARQWYVIHVTCVMLCFVWAQVTDATDRLSCLPLVVLCSHAATVLYCLWR